MLSLSRQAVREAHVELDPTLSNEEIIDVTVSFDGSWPKRGHTSLIGFASVIDIMTGLVLDFIILSKHCHVCAVNKLEICDELSFEKWKEQHVESGECDINFHGASGEMETSGARFLWERSIDKNQMRYTRILSDGDAKVISVLNELKPYRENIIIEKEECVNHVGKRLGTALRNLVRDEKARGVTLEGNKAGALKETTIVKMQSYYQKAIKSTLRNISLAKKEIMASIDHMNSTDVKPKHSHCPRGKDSWCFYWRAKAQKKIPKSHSQMSVFINNLVYDKIKPIYTRLSSDDLFSRCVRLGNQNSNESLPSVIWNKCPKEIFMSKRRYEIGITRGIGEFNMGLQTMNDVKGDSSQKIKKSVGSKIAQKIDSRRNEQSRKQSSRIRRRAQRKQEKKTTKSKKTKPHYDPGAF